MILHASHDDRRFRIEETNDGFYVYVFEGDQCTQDYLQETLVLAKEFAREHLGSLRIVGARHLQRSDQRAAISADIYQS